jgi:hypothetical protein
MTYVQKEDKRIVYHTQERFKILWDRIKIIFPKEKPSKTIGRPVVPFRKVLLMMVFYTFSNNEMSMMEDVVTFWVGIWFTGHMILKMD